MKIIKATLAIITTMSISLAGCAPAKSSASNLRKLANNTKKLSVIPSMRNLKISFLNKCFDRST